MYEINNDQYPFEINYVDESTNKDLMKNFTSEYTGFIQVGDKKWCLPSNISYELNDFYNMEVRPTDVWVVTFPRSGTTLTQEMVWLLMNDLNYEAASKTPLEQRYPFLEFHSLIHKKQKEIFVEENKHCEEKRKTVENILAGMFDHLKKMKGRRFIKSHLPLSLLPKNLLTVGCKVIYVARNPKDVAISFYHHNRLFRTRGYVGDFPTYWKYFTQNLVVYTPYWDHIIEAWNKRNEKNILFLFFENTIKDMKGTISQLQHFLGTNFNEQQIDTLMKHLHIDKFQKNKSVNFNVLIELGIFAKGEEGFVRQGKTGEHGNYFSEEENEKANKWIEDNLKCTDLRFPA
ncbi:hypothetical protein WA026_005837 [Henosepilachna vigintioctopunctata]|uniref:Sulfotransferase domain-containing protein n=1 Tax=Henosepilachna vigintioctopunctata TaxID=420089 RepID=A0AAW1TW93_9CUCU